MPHGRLVGAAVTYSLVLALSIAGVAVVGLLLSLSWSPPDGPPDNGPIRGLAVLLFIGAPTSFFASLVVTVPMTYLCWRRRPVTKSSLAKLVSVAAGAAAVPLAYVGMGLTFSPYAHFLFACASLLAMVAVVLGIPTVAWWFAAPRALTGRSGGA